MEKKEKPNKQPANYKSKGIKMFFKKVGYIVLTAIITAAVAAGVALYMIEPTAEKEGRINDELSMCSVYVYSNVDNASVEINNDLKTKTVADSAVFVGKYSPGSYVVILKKSGYYTEEISNEISSGQKNHTILAKLIQQKKQKPKNKIIIIIDGDPEPKELPAKD